MSLKYRDSQGNETPVAGLNGTSGELVPSTALMKSGVATVSMPNTSSLDQLFTVQVTFDTPFEDANYVLNVDQCEVSEAEINRVFDRTASGFYIAVMYNRWRTAVPSYNVTARIPWQAFKLMTDEDRALDEQAIADLQAVVPSTATSSNQLVPANGKVRGLNTGNWISDDFNNAVPSDNSSMQIFTVLNSATNSPGLGANYIVLTQVFSSELIQQEAIQNGTNYRYIRNCDSGTWSAWSRIATEKECVLYKTVSSISDIRALAKSRSYFVVTTASITLQDDVGASYEIPAGSVSTPFHWNGGDTHINFCFNYPVASAHIWAVFLNSNGQNRAKRIV